MSRFKVCLMALSLGLVVATPAFGQRASRSRAMVGISAGAATSDIEGGFINTSSRWGFIGGVFGVIRTSRNSMVGLEHDILGLDIPVDDIMTVGIAQRVRHLSGYVECIVQWELFLAVEPAAQ